LKDKLYLGATTSGSDEANVKNYYYNARHLRTHAVCVGMTGSGKTGLCIGLLEELSMRGTPSIIIDPKGDLCNLLLAFPHLSAGEFKPWVQPDEAERQGITVDQLAANEAKGWETGLDMWGLGSSDIRKFNQSVEKRIYTPASRSGIPLSVLASFDAPAPGVRKNAEAMRERVNTTVASLLGLIGVKSDPVKDREAILVATILMHSWTDGVHIDLYGLVTQIMSPPVHRMGAISMDEFYPEKDRAKLAVKINNLLASPGFGAWMEGESLDIDALLYSPDGKPRCSIMSIAHLSDPERMFFVSLLLNEYVSWMRAQPGSTDLRSVLYMDEIAGYLPPSRMPPSKQPMLTLLKQARAFGCGVVLATQNPVDLDYKALSNMGTWFIGRLQQERDQDRLMKGLANSDNPMNVRTISRTLSGLKKRQFMVHNASEGTKTFDTRWCMSYLAGPMTREGINSVMAKHVDVDAIDAARKEQARKAKMTRLQSQLVEATEEVEAIDEEIDTILALGKAKEQRDTFSSLLMGLFSSSRMAVRDAVRERKNLTAGQRGRLDKLRERLGEIEIESRQMYADLQDLKSQQGGSIM
jgi:hypothetical protein